MFSYDTFPKHVRQVVNALSLTGPQFWVVTGFYSLYLPCSIKYPVLQCCILGPPDSYPPTPYKTLMFKWRQYSNVSLKMHVANYTTASHELDHPCLRLLAFYGIPIFPTSLIRRIFHLLTVWDTIYYITLFLRAMKKLECSFSQLKKLLPC